MQREHTKKAELVCGRKFRHMCFYFDSTQPNNGFLMATVARAIFPHCCEIINEHTIKHNGISTVFSPLL